MKKLTAFLLSFAMLFALMPQGFADRYVNEAYVGTYLSAGATQNNYGKLDILECTDTDVRVKFMFVKNGNQQLYYTCEPGKMNGDKGSLRFSVSYGDGRFVSNGTMEITLDDWCVRISCDSDQGQHLFDGMMKPEFNLDPFNSPGSNPPSPTDAPVINSNVNVSLNGEMVEFQDGVKPVIINDHTYVPLRSVFGKMGINVYWDQYKKNDILNAQTITCTKNDIIVQFSRTFNESGNNLWTLTKWVGESTDSLNFQKINISGLQPTIIENRSYIPLRVVSEAFEANVGWLGDERLVEIECDTANQYLYDADTIASMEDYLELNAAAYITEDFTDVVADSTPYFSPQAKFYKFKAKDMWGDVTLHVIYGGYIDVFSALSEAEDLADIPSDAPESNVPEETPQEVTEEVVPEAEGDVTEDFAPETEGDITEDVGPETGTKTPEADADATEDDAPETEEMETPITE